MTKHFNKLTIHSALGLIALGILAAVFSGSVSADEETSGTAAGTVVSEEEPVLYDVCRTDDGGTTYTFVSGVPESELRDSDVYNGEDGISVTGQADCDALEPEVEEEPPAPADTDGDGIPDGSDPCPDEAPTTDADGDGCEDPPVENNDPPENEPTPTPTPTPAADSDGDSVTDDVDACPDAAPSVDEDGDGCEDEAAAAGDIGTTAVCPTTVAPFGEPPAGCGEIRICKQFDFGPILDNEGQQASFTTGGNGLPASFSLAHDVCAPEVGQPAFALTPGTYTVTETLATLPEFFKLSDVTCLGDDVPDTDDNATATINLAEGEDVICTFTNVVEIAGLQICKLFVPETPGIQAQFETDIPDASSFSLPTAPGQNCNPNLDAFDVLPGTYTVTETLTPAGFQLTDIDCINFNDFDANLQTGTLEVTLEDLDSVTCVFTNTAVGGGCNTTAVAGFGQTFCIEVCKITLPPGVNQEFDVGDTGLNPSTNPCFTLPSVDPGTTRFFTETVPTGWTLSDIICQGDGIFQYGVEGGSFDSTFIPGEDTASVQLVDGDAQCIFTNTLAEGAGTIEICKNFDRFVAGTPADQQAQFTGDNGFTANFTLGDDDIGELDCEGPIALAGGETYTIQEDLAALPEFFELGGVNQGILCEGDTNSVVTPNEAAGSVQIELAAGDNVSCTFNNRQQFAGQQICKDFVGTLAGTEQAEFTSDAPGLTFFVLADNGCNPANSNTTQNVLPGDYTVTEDLDALPAGFVLTDIACETVGGTPVNFPVDEDLAAGSMDISLTELDFITCIFTNTQVGGGCTTPAVAGFGLDQTGCVEICKVTTPTANADVNFVFTGLDGFTINPSEEECFVDQQVSVGVEQTITEDPIPSGWELDDIVCNAASGDAEFEVTKPSVAITLLVQGGSVRCVFINVELDIGGGCAAATVAGFGPPPTGCIEICKVVTSGSDQSQEFTYDTEGTGLTIDPLSHGECDVADDLPAGGGEVYFITEIIPPGWNIELIECDASDGSFTGTLVGGEGEQGDDFEPGDDTIRVDLGAGGIVSCLFTNDEGPPEGAFVCKETDSPTDQQFLFDVQLEIGEGGPIESGQFTLDSGECITWDGLLDLLNIDIGSETQISAVIEEVVPEGWTNTAIDCGGAEDGIDIPGVTITFDPTGEIPLCTFFNEEGEEPGDCITPDVAGFGEETPECGFLQVCKNFLPSVGAEIEAAFETDYVFQAGPDFSLADEQCFPSLETGVPLPPGTYLIQELIDLLPPGFVFSDFTSCRIVSGGGVGDDSTFDVDVPNAQVTVNLAAGDFVNCDMVNDEDRASITICKVTDPPHADQDFRWDLTSPSLDDFFLINPGGNAEEPDCRILFPDAEPGEYTFHESVPPGWSLASITCTGDEESTISADPNADPQLEITLVAGEDIVCTFTNTQECITSPAVAGFGSTTIPQCGFIRICKDFVTDDPSGLEVDFASDLVPGNGADFTLSDEECFPEGETPLALPPGDYFAREILNSLPDGFVFDDIECLISGETSSTSIVDNRVDIFLTSGNVVTCIFFNIEEEVEADGPFVCKETDPESTQEFTFNIDIEVGEGGQHAVGQFTLDAGQCISLSELQEVLGGFTLLDQLSAVIEELDPDGSGGWTLVEIDCGGAEDGIDLPAVTITFNPNEDVPTCTFFNERETPPGDDDDADDDDADDDDDQPGQRQPRPRAPQPGGKPGVGTGDGSFGESADGSRNVMLPVLAFLGATGLLTLGFTHWQRRR